MPRAGPDREYVVCAIEVELLTSCHPDLQVRDTRVMLKEREHENSPISSHLVRDENQSNAMVTRHR